MRPGPASAASTARKPQIVDTHAALDRIGGDCGLMRELATIFIEDSPELLRALQASVDAGDLSRAEHCAHGLKGIAANVGGVRVSSVAAVVEDAVRAGHLQLASAGVQTLATELDQLIDALKSIPLDDGEPRR